MIDWDPDQYARNAAYVSELGVPVLNQKLIKIC